MSGKIARKDKLVKQYSMSRQTAGDQFPVIPVEHQEEEEHQHPRPWQMSVKKLKDSEEEDITSSNNQDDSRSKIEAMYAMDALQNDQYEYIDTPYTHIDDALPSDGFSPSQDHTENKALEDLEDIVIEKKMDLSNPMALPKNQHETDVLRFSLNNSSGFRKSISPLPPDPNEDQVVEIDCCETYLESCYITFTCGIPILMKQRRARRDETVTINPDNPPHHKSDDFQINHEETDQHTSVCLKTLLNVFLLTVTCGIYGLIRDLRSQPTPIKSVAFYEEVIPPSDAPDTPLVDDAATPESALQCSRFTDTLCLIATCGLYRRFQQPPEPSAPEPKAESKEICYTIINEVTYEEAQSPQIEVIDEANMPIVSLTATQVQVLKEIAPVVYTSLAHYDPEATSNECTSCCKSCMDTCCQTCSFDFTSMLSRSTRNKGPRMEKEELFTPTLEKASNEGGKMIQKIIFPLVLDVAREVWVALELVTILIGLILSIATVSFNQNEVFNILHLILIIISSILAAVDAFSSLVKCRSCKRCYYHIKKKDGNFDTSNERNTKPCLRCLYWCNQKLDIARIIVTEVLVYPLLVCDIFEVIVGRGHEGNSHSDRLGFALFLLSCFSLLLYVYVVRVLVLGRSMRRLHEIRSLEFRSNRQSDEAAHFAVKEAFKYQLCFFVHVIMQMLAQIMMLIAIGGKIRYDNRHFYEPGNTDEAIYYSGYLIAMLIIGYIAPTLGYLSFLLVTKRWAQEFPIGVFNDLKCQLKFLKQGGPENFLSDSDEMNDTDEEKLGGKFKGQPSWKQLSKVEKVHRFMTQFSHDYKNLLNMTFTKKIEYPFKSPGIVILSILYAAMQLAFIVCAGVAVDDMGVVVSQILNGGGWVVYYVFAIIFGAIANIYIFLVAGFWIFVVAVIIAIIAGILLCFVLVCMIAACGGSSRND